MNYLVLSGLLLFSTHVFASTYSCDDKEIKATIEVEMDEAQFNGVDVMTYKKKVIKQATKDVLLEDSGIGSIKKDYKEGKFFSKSYVMASGDKFIIVNDPKEAYLLKSYASGNGVAKFECSEIN